MSSAVIKIIVSAIAVILSSRLLFSRKYRENAIFATVAGLIAVGASFVLFQTLWDRFGPQQVKLSISASEAQKNEGNTGTTDFLFRVTRTGRLTDAVTVEWQLACADAADFGGRLPRGHVSFAPEVDEQLIRVPVSGDREVEETEFFGVILSNPQPNSVMLQNGVATGIIRNDDKQVTDARSPARGFDTRPPERSKTDRVERPPVPSAREHSRQPFEPEIVCLTGGTFMMGSPEGETGRYAEEGPQHLVRIASFEVGKYEVTWDQWDACVRDKGCDGSGPQNHGGDVGWGKGRRPVINVSWTDAKDYVAWLRRKTGKAYRLLSEAEWEYAARAGSTARYSWGDEEPVCNESARNGANFKACPDSTRPVGSFMPNEFGLYDMHGNVLEWVEDCWNESYHGAPADGSARVTDCKRTRRVIRGGAWFHDSQLLDSALRGSAYPDSPNPLLGFRVARTLQR